MTEKKVLCLEAEKANEGDYQTVILRNGICNQCKALERQGRPTEIAVRTEDGEKFVRECKQNLD